MNLNNFSGFLLTTAEAGTILGRSASFVRSICRANYLTSASLRRGKEGRGWAIALEEVIYFAWATGLVVDRGEVERVIACYPAEYIKAIEEDRVIEYHQSLLAGGK